MTLKVYFIYLSLCTHSAYRNPFRGGGRIFTLGLFLAKFSDCVAGEEEEEEEEEMEQLMALKNKKGTYLHGVPLR